MAQRNIDFGTFPDDPDADAIRTAFEKSQLNFTELFAGLGARAVTSLKGGAGITLSSPTGNITITANIACVQVSTSTLSIGVGSNGSQTARLTSSSQLLVIDLPTNIANVANIDLSNTLTANTVNVNANINGNVGSFTGNVIASNLTANSTLIVTGNANVGNLNASGNGSFAGNLAVTANITVGNVYANSGTVRATTANISENITAGNVYANTGIIQAQYLKGDGSNISNVVAVIAASISNGNSNVNIPAANGNVTISSAGNANVAVITGTGLDVNGSIIAANITANTGVITGNGNGLSQLVGANVTGTVASATAATNASALLQNTSTSTTVYPTFTTSSANGNSSAVINTAISANLGNASITATTFVGDLSGAATTAGTVTTNAQPNITSVGTLTVLDVNGNITAANITANTGVFTGNGSGLTQLTGANVTGTVANATYALSSGTSGTVTTNAQPNITSVGTLSALDVTANITAGNIGGANLIAANYLSGNGSSISSITGANVTGTVANATYALSSGSSDTAATVTTNAQPNITSVGTLSGVDVTANVTAGNVYANAGIIQAQYLKGDGSNISNLVVSAGSYIFNGTSNVVVDLNANVNISASGNANIVTVTGTGANITGNADVTGNLSASNISATRISGPLTTASQPNVTSLGTLTGLTVNGVTNLGAVSNVTITGGGSNYFLRTDGSGALSWVNATTLTTAPGSNTQVLFNDAGSFGANPNLTFDKTTGNVNINGNLAVANIAGGNLISANYLSGVLTSTHPEQPNITSVGTLTSLTVNGITNTLRLSVSSGTLTANTPANILQTWNNSGVQFSAIRVNITDTLSDGNSSLLDLQTGGVSQFYVRKDGVVYGNGYGLTSIAGANVTGAVSSATVAGTVTTNAQPNITSLGTLTTLNTAFIYSGSGTSVSSTTSTIQASGDISLFGSGAQSLIYSGYYGGGNWKYATTGQYAGAVRFDSTAGKMQIWSSTNTGTAGANADVTPRLTIDRLGNVGIGTQSPAYTLAVNGNIAGGQILASANVTSPQLISNIATGTAPFLVSSNTVVANLNADLLDGYNTATANTASTIAVRDANGNLSANFFTGNGSQLTGIITSVSNVSNGTSNLNIPVASGNVNISSAGNANVVVVTGTSILRNSLNIPTFAYQASTPPANALSGDQWYNTVTGVLFEYLNDGTTAQWVDVGTIPATTTSNIANGTSNVSIPASSGNVNISSAGNANVVTITGTSILRNSRNITTFVYQASTPPSSPLDGDQWYNTVTGVLFEYLNDGTSVQWVDIGTIPLTTGVNATTLANGTSNINIPVISGNVTISSAGNANILTITGTGVNVAGTLNTGSGNISTTTGYVKVGSGTPAAATATWIQPGYIDAWDVDVHDWLTIYYNNQNGLLQWKDTAGSLNGYSMWLKPGNILTLGLGSQGANVVTFDQSKTANFYGNVNVATSNVTAANFIGDGSQLTGILPSLSYRTVTANTTITSTDALIMANGMLTITLPAASTVSGRQFYIKNINSSNAVVTINPTGTDLIDGKANASIAYYNTMLGVVSVSTGWILF